MFGYPPGEAATLAVNVVQSINTPIERVKLVAFDEETYDRYLSLLRY